MQSSPKSPRARGWKKRLVFSLMALALLLVMTEFASLAVYRIVTTRSKDMGAVQRSILGHAAGSAQEKVAEALEARLR